jgi:Skp family chaperone for outer membrane proteins
MTRIILAAAAAFALSAAAPAFACPDCKDCPQHAAMDKGAKKEGEAKKCPCGATSAKDCKCGTKCECHAKKTEKKDAEKKS